MGFTIEDMMTISEKRYQMKLIAGKGGWSNSISWPIMLEDRKIIRNFSGKELAVTTGLGFGDETSFMELLHDLDQSHAAGIIVNLGPYISSLPETAVDFCDRQNLPLLTVPWDVYLADMIKDLSIRVFLQGTTDEEISKALIHAIETPEDQSHYVDDLRPYFGVDDSFQVVVLTTEGLSGMDTVDRRRLAYRLQLSLSNLTHNGHFFYYDSFFVIVINALSEAFVRDLIETYRQNLKRRLPKKPFIIGIGSRVGDITLLYRSFQRARAAVLYAAAERAEVKSFDQMGICRLLYSVSDSSLLEEMSAVPLAPLIEYDKKHDSCYVETLDCYLRNDGSIQRISEELYTHRNTVIYRMNNIRELLGCELKTADEKLQYRLACMIYLRVSR